MAYNSGFPMGYQFIYPQDQYQVPQVQTSRPQQMVGRVWVSGEAGAKAYILAPNSSAELWD